MTKRTLEAARWIKNAVERLRYHNTSLRDFRGLLNREERMLFNGDRKWLVIVLNHARNMGKAVFAEKVSHARYMSIHSMGEE
jgi:hypothetical protein